MKNFFEHQDIARKNTFRLVVLFSLAVLLTILCVYFVTVIAIEGQALWNPMAHDGVTTASWINFDALLLSAVATISVVGGGTFFKIRRLARGGGSLVCEELGGRFIDFRTDDLAEQRLINVVEEMSIASGVSVPLLYVLDKEAGINAFAAGFTPNNAAIAVSRGCLELLNRDELQGVVAHEFSHILNGDMRMNIRMIGILHGILMLAVTGRVLLRLSVAGSSGRSRSGRNSGGGVIWLALAGVALFVIGYVGRFFGALIKSAISRQREYLADASAVQFTRNPKGLAGALMKIGGYSDGSRIRSPQADEVSHIFFGNALEESWLNTLFATHPPLKKRIRRIDPHFSGAFRKVEKPKRLVEKMRDDSPRWNLPGNLGKSARPAGAAGIAAGAQLAADGGSPAREQPRDQTRRMKLDADTVVGSTGQTSQEHVDYARDALEAIPPQIREAARDPYSAAAVVFALLIDVDLDTRKSQLEVISKQLTRGLAQETRGFVQQLEELDPLYRLPLVEILVPALRQMSRDQHQMFTGILDKLILADQQVSLFEFSLEKLLKHRLEASHGAGGRRVAQYYTLTPLRNDVVLLLSHLAHAGHDEIAAAELAFREGVDCLKNATIRKKAQLMAESRCSFEALDAALDRIAQTTNAVKQKIVDATAHCVLADKEVTAEEAELLRAICEVIDVPLPPFLPDLAAEEN